MAIKCIKVIHLENWKPKNIWKKIYTLKMILCYYIKENATYCLNKQYV